MQQGDEVIDPVGDEIVGRYPLDFLGVDEEPRSLTPRAERGFVRKADRSLAKV